MKERHQDGGIYWKVALGLMVGVFLVGMVTSLVLASRRVSRVVDPDYYQHGLHYGETSSSAAKR
jgi:FixH